MHSASRGFTLLEAMVVLVVVGVVAAISLDMLTGQAKAEARRQMITQQATEMATLNRAVNEWVRTATGLPTNPGDILEVDLQDVVDAGRLPGEFARRPASGSADPISPLGQPYRAFIRRTTSGSYEIAVMPLGPPLAGFSARAGITPEAESLRVWNVAVMQEIRSRFTLPAGVINEGSSTIDSAASGFTLDLGSFLGGNAADMTIAALSNFAELATIDESTKVEDNFIGKTCRFVTDNTLCAADEKSAIEHTICERTGAEFHSSPVSELKITPIGNLQIERSTFVTRSFNPYGTHYTSTLGIDATVVQRSASWVSGWNVECELRQTGSRFQCVVGGSDQEAWRSALMVLPGTSETTGRNLTEAPLALMTSQRPNREVFPVSGSLITLENVSAEPIATKAACGGALSAPLPIWSATARFEANAQVRPSSPSTPVHVASVTRPGSVLAIGSTHNERVSLAGFTTISHTCETNTIERVGSVFMTPVRGQSTQPIGVNSCPSVSNPPDTQNFSSGQAASQPWERLRNRVPANDMLTLRICCK